MEAQDLISKILEPDPVKRSVLFSAVYQSPISHLNNSCSTYQSKLKIFIAIHSILL